MTLSPIPTGKRPVPQRGDAKSDAVDPALVYVARAWRGLPSHIPATIRTLLDSAKNSTVDPG